MVAGVTARLAESNGSLPPGLWLMSPAGWLPKTGIGTGTIRSVIEYGLPSPFYLVRLVLTWQRLLLVHGADRLISARGRVTNAKPKKYDDTVHGVARLIGVARSDYVTARATRRLINRLEHRSNSSSGGGGMTATMAGGRHQAVWGPLHLDLFIDVTNVYNVYRNFVNKRVCYFCQRLLF